MHRSRHSVEVTDYIEPMNQRDPPLAPPQEVLRALAWCWAESPPPEGTQGRVSLYPTSRFTLPCPLRRRGNGYGLARRDTEIREEPPPEGQGEGAVSVRLLLGSPLSAIG